jgi:hypothetical protein
MKAERREERRRARQAKQAAGNHRDEHHGTYLQACEFLVRRDANKATYTPKSRCM